MRIAYIILLLIWFALGTWWARNTFCGTKTKAKPAASAAAGAAAAKGGCNRSLIFNDGDGLELKSNVNFVFGNKSAKLRDPSSSLVPILEKVAAYLKSNPDRAMKIEAHYHKKEGKNLGESRANSIKQYLVNDHKISGDQLMVNTSELGSTSCFNSSSKTLQKGATISFGEKL